MEESVLLFPLLNIEQQQEEELLAHEAHGRILDGPMVGATEAIYQSLGLRPT